MRSTVKKEQVRKIFSGGAGGDRTHDRRIMSPLRQESPAAGHSPGTPECLVRARTQDAHSDSRRPRTLGRVLPEC